ncbi:DUF262 domain-containing protein [Mesorhizobium sp. M0185]|uniref:DUF262 domain-containing protein n=1 Tax=Mesorhizobium sp. M0185 TaxID=2956907 RepID=UPI00333C4537
MAESVVLDAMIKRDDFAITNTAPSSGEPIKTLSIETLSSSGMLVPLLRKPDFQRETNHWSPTQVVSFLESFLDNELIPSIILWRSTQFVFVIDGGHRLSALRAWIDDDYGDGPNSIGYYSNEINSAQRRIAKKARDMVELKIGKYSLLRDALIKPENHPEQRVVRARNMATRSLSLQWVEGDADKAETSFFKINTQGTPLDDAEETLLRNRNRSIAIAARSIIRAATGHKYWSKFLDDNRAKIETSAKKLHSLFFNPEVNQPIKTLDLPLGGTRSPIQSLDMLMNLISLTNADQGTIRRPLGEFPEDPDGSETVKVLETCSRIAARLTGTGPSSLGLHPAVYFYTERGRHLPDLLLGFLLLCRNKLQSNDPTFFRKFTENRKKIEDFLIENKAIITQALQIVRSKNRVEKVSDLFNYLIQSYDEGKNPTDNEIIAVIAPNSVSKILSITQGADGERFSDDAKSAIFIRQALKNAMKCPICHGYLDPAKSSSYDHVVRVQDGGKGGDLNGQITHPYCNTAMKN